MKTVPGTETRVRVVYPKSQQDIFEDSTFLMGAVTARPAGVKLWVNGHEVPVSEHGFFAWKVPIHAGLNPIKMEVRTSPSTPPIAQHLLALHGVPPLKILPAQPLAIHQNTLQPDSDCWLSDSDVLTVACSASEGATVGFSIPGFVEQIIPMPPLVSDQPYLDTREVIFAQSHWTKARIPTRGYYKAAVPVAELYRLAGVSPDSGERNELPMVLHLKHGTVTKQIPISGKLSLLSTPRQALIDADNTVSRTSPVDGARLTPQMAQTQVQVDGLFQDWARVRLSREESMYVPLEALQWLSAPLPVLALSHIRTESKNASESWVHLAFAGNPSQACPVQLESVPSERMNRLQIRLYGVCSRCDFIQYPPDDAIIQQIHWRQVADDVMEVWIDLNRPLAGYDYAWNAGEWRLTVRTLPSRLADIRVLIDPGHGGPESGSTGLNGLPEKDLNLTVSRLLRDALTREGFAVSMTRTADQEMTLPARGQRVQAEQPHIVLSLHHNALPDGRDPLAVEGASCFYYQAFAKPLADALLAGMTQNQGSRFQVPNYGLFYDSLYMTRIHEATAVLVEVGFFTNPHEFERLINPAFQQDMVGRLASALRAYCVSRS